MGARAFLAIWSDVAREHETDYLHWLTREHTAERLGVNGFLAVRVYRALKNDVSRYFIHYELASRAVLVSEDYARRLNAPTPWSQRIMPILGSFMRGGGEVVRQMGDGHGTFLAAVRFNAPPLPDADVMDRMLRRDRIIAIRLLRTDLARTSMETNEKRLRTKDASFDGLLLVEGLSEAAVSDAVASAGLAGQGESYSQIFQLSR